MNSAMNVLLNDDQMQKKGGLRRSQVWMDVKIRAGVIMCRGIRIGILLLIRYSLRTMLSMMLMLILLKYIKKNQTTTSVYFILMLDQY